MKCACILLRDGTLEIFEDVRRSLVFRIERNKAMTMKKTSVGVLVLLMAMGASVCYGQDEGFTIDNEFSTKYMWRGFDVFDDHGAWMPSVDFDLGEGWGFNVWGAQPFGSGSEELKELDYTLSFSNTVNEGETDEMEYSVGWIYYDFPEANSDADAQEIGLGLSWPSALSDGDLPLMPSVYVGSFMPESGDDGVYVNLRVDWEVVCPDIDQVLNMYSDISYNDSIGFDGNGNQVG